MEGLSRFSILLRRLLVIAVAIAGAVLLARAWWGPFRLGVSVQSPMNAESIFAFTVTVVLLIGARESERTDGRSAITLRDAWLAAALAAACFVAFVPSLRVGFVADDYAHLLNVSKAGPGFFLDQFTVPAPDRFFRPLGMLSYWLDFQWAGFSEWRWHVAGVIYHVANAVLVFLLLALLGVERTPAWAGAAMFGLHGSRPEAATWVSARFDLLATLFVLAAAVAFVAYARRPGNALAAMVLAASLGALLSKESAYVLPLLFACVLVFSPELRTPRLLRLTGVVAAMTFAVFAYRWCALRLWAVLYFPLNWTDRFSVLLLIALTGATAIWFWLAVRGGADKKRLQLGLAWTLVAALPVYHLLLIDADLEKSRVVYLSSVGFGMMTAAVITGAGQWRAAAAALLLLFQAGALRHNLATWDRVSRVHTRACSDLAAAMKTTPGPAIAADMPNVFDGVYMLNTGLPACLEVRHGIPETMLTVVPTLEAARALDSSVPLYTWDKQAARIIPAKR